METKTKVILVASLLAATGIGVTLYFVLRKKSDIIDTTTSDSDSGTTSAPDTAPSSELPTPLPGETPSKAKARIALAKAQVKANLRYPPPRGKKRKEKYQQMVYDIMIQGGFTYTKK